ncbi:MAG: 16S rRNA (guanine(966)-N(2))-methyltransferase RsmD [Steroidobacteraceae bacterium]
MQRRGPRELRIIAGEWRGRRLRFPAGTTIRPTPDRVRETLFNWLSARISGARVLDLFAGSGALGLESLSRGATAATFVDSDARALAALREHLAEWGAHGATTVRADALAWLEAGPPRGEPPFDIAFLDPPFDAGLLEQACRRLEARGWLAPGAWIYLEAPVREPLPPLPGGWQPWRTGTAGEVGYHLLQRAAERQDAQARA